MSKDPSARPGQGLRPDRPDAHLLFEAKDLSKEYSGSGRSSGGPVRVFAGLSFTISRGQLLAIVGQSGSGKSSLLHILGALDRPSTGEVLFDGQPLSRLDAAGSARFRNREVGYVWQFHYLLPEFTALENIALPLLARGVSQRAARQTAAGWLQRVGLCDRAEHQAGELSGGQQQRVSIARALVGNPRVLLADEPTGDLDEATAEAVFGLIAQLHRDQGLTTVLVTHNMALARRCGRVLRLTEGRLQELSPATL